MEALQQKFWNCIRQITSRDNTVEVSSATVSKALNIFQSNSSERSRYLFRFRPVAATGLRKAGPSRKYLYELNGAMVVQLEVNADAAGSHLHGVTHGFDDASVLLYAKEYVDQTSIVEGCFEFRSIVPGTIHLCFSFEGRDYWVTDLELEEKSNG